MAATVAMTVEIAPMPVAEAPPAPSRKVPSAATLLRKQMAINIMEVGHERLDVCLWALVTRDHQFACVHHLRVQLREAAIAA
jgi:hypothetical protein